VHCRALMGGRCAASVRGRTSCVRARARMRLSLTLLMISLTLLLTPMVRVTMMRVAGWRLLIATTIATTIAADLLIRDSERRCAAVLLRLGGRRYSGPKDKEPVEVPVTQIELPAVSETNQHPDPGRAASKGMRSKKRVEDFAVGTSRRETGRVSQAGKTAQARKDSDKT